MEAEQNLAITKEMVSELEPASFAFSGESPVDLAGAGEGSFSAGPQETFWVWNNSYARALAKLRDPNVYDNLYRENQRSAPFGAGTRSLLGSQARSWAI